MLFVYLVFIYNYVVCNNCTSGASTLGLPHVHFFMFKKVNKLLQNTMRKVTIDRPTPDDFYLFFIFVPNLEARGTLETKRGTTGRKETRSCYSDWVSVEQILNVKIIF